MHERAGEQQAPAHAARELGRAGGGLRAQVEDVHHLAGAAARVGAAHPVVAAVVDERLLDVEEAVEVDVLLGEADRPARLDRVVAVAEHERLAGGGADRGCRRPRSAWSCRRRLARAGRRTRRRGMTRSTASSASRPSSYRLVSPRSSSAGVAVARVPRYPRGIHTWVHARFTAAGKVLSVTRIAIVDPQPAVRAGLAALLRSSPGSCPSPPPARRGGARDCARTAPDLVLLEPLLGTGDGLQLIRRITGGEQAPRVVAYTEVGDPALEIALRVAGADGSSTSRRRRRSSSRRCAPSPAGARRSRSSRRGNCAPPRRASRATTLRCSRCSSTARRSPMWPTRCTSTAAAWRGASSACWRACARAPARPQPPDPATR